MRGRLDWYFDPDWTPEAQVQFEAELRRARNKLQAIVMRAGALANAGGEHRVFGALGLLGRYFADAPVPDFHESKAYSIRASCYLQLGNDPAAVESFRSSLDARRRLPHDRDGVWFKCARVAIERKWVDGYDEALKGLSDFEPGPLPFPVDQYEAEAIRAAIAAARGKRPAARRHAIAAIAAACVADSGIQRCPTIGLVGDRAGDPLWPLVSELACTPDGGAGEYVDRS